MVYCVVCCAVTFNSPAEGGLYAFYAANVWALKVYTDTCCIWFIAILYYSLQVIVAAELLKHAEELVKYKIHPTSVITGYRLACKYGMGMGCLEWNLGERIQ